MLASNPEFLLSASSVEYFGNPWITVISQCRACADLERCVNCSPRSLERYVSSPPPRPSSSMRPQHRQTHKPRRSLLERMWLVSQSLGLGPSTPSPRPSPAPRWGLQPCIGVPWRRPLCRPFALPNRQDRSPRNATRKGPDILCCAPSSGERHPPPIGSSWRPTPLTADFCVRHPNLTAGAQLACPGPAPWLLRSPIRAALALEPIALPAFLRPSRLPPSPPSPVSPSPSPPCPQPQQAVPLERGDVQPSQARPLAHSTNTAP